MVQDRDRWWAFVDAMEFRVSGKVDRTLSLGLGILISLDRLSCSPCN